MEPSTETTLRSSLGQPEDHHMNQLTICNTSIRQDTEGRYCLNDLHRAAGGEARHTPGRFTITQTFNDLVDEISRNTDIACYRGLQGVGTFVVKELVYAYAMWISPKFHLQVIRAYDTLVTQPAVPVFAAPGNLREALLLALAQEEKIESLKATTALLEAEVTVAAPKVAVYDEVVADKELLVSNFAKMLNGVNSIATLSDLRMAGYLFRPQRGEYRVYSQYRDTLFKETIDPVYGKRSITVLDKGKIEMTKLYKAGRLTMRAGFKSAVLA